MSSVLALRLAIARAEMSLGLALDECICSAKFMENCRKDISRNQLEMGIKYCQGLELELPRYVHIEYKPRYSAKRSNIFKVGTATTTTTFMEREKYFHREADPMVMADVQQPGGDDGRGGLGDVRDVDGHEGQ